MQEGLLKDLVITNEPHLGNWECFLPYPSALWVALDVLGQFQLTLEIPHFEIEICHSACEGF